VKRLRPYRGSFFQFVLGNVLFAGCLAAVLVVTDSALGRGPSRALRHSTGSFDTASVLRDFEGLRASLSGVAADAESERVFLERAIEIGARLRLAEVAVQQAGHPDVRALAEDIARDARRWEHTIRALAVRSGIELSLPAAMEASIATMDTPAGAEFDVLFIERMIALHEQAIAVASDAMHESLDPAFRAAASRQLPALEGNRDRARALAAILPSARSDR
jgi:predicted outer membrane protein